MTIALQRASIWQHIKIKLFHWRGSWFGHMKSMTIPLEMALIRKSDDHCFAEGLDMKAHENQWPFHWIGSWYKLMKSMTIPSERTLIWKIDDHCFAEGLDMKANENQWPFHRRGSWYRHMKSMTIPSERALIWKHMKINDHSINMSRIARPLQRLN